MLSQDIRSMCVFYNSHHDFSCFFSLFQLSFAKMHNIREKDIFVNDHTKLASAQDLLVKDKTWNFMTHERYAHLAGSKLMTIF